VVKGDVPQKNVDILLSATLIILLKKDEETMKAMKMQHGVAYYIQPQGPIGMGTPIVKSACKCALQLVKEAMGPAVGPSQFAVRRRFDLTIWDLDKAQLYGSVF
jgi:hypothetical protein